MAISDDQSEELEALGYIFPEEELIKNSTDPVSITIKQQVENDETKKIVAAAIQFDWPENYPAEAPEISIKSIDLNDAQISKILSDIQETITSNLGCAMTYTLVDAIKEELHNISSIKEEVVEVQQEANEESEVTKSSKQLEKERKMYAKEKEKERTRQRGWNWVDVIHHLRQLPSYAQNDEE
ncbi:hypothetical protein WA158_001127 [Blastocystis sp. Blastoise]